jgi:uncharacterized protein
VDLRRKLARLSKQAPAVEEIALPTERGTKIAELRALIGDVASRQRRRQERMSPAAEPEGPPPWAAIETVHGALHVLERDLEPDHHHGRVPVVSALTPSAATVAALAVDASLAQLDLSRMLLLDTETTGLSGGTGTVAFLVGLARFEEGALRIEQLVLPNLGAEAPMLAHLAQRLREASCIVSYNGKSFDWPLLRTRFVLSRMPAPPLPPHIDLLHTTRRVWKARLGSVRLTEIEREILHFEREGDIDGAEIPGRYFAFLREGGAARLAPVLEHNQNDLIALAAMLGKLGQHYEDAGSVEHAEDALAFGRLCARVKDKSRALTFAQGALDASRSERMSRAALELTFDVEKKWGDPTAAARALEAALELAMGAEERARLHLALAKLYERQLRNLEAALAHAAHTEVVEGEEAHARRMARLRKRLARAQEARA